VRRSRVRVLVVLLIVVLVGLLLVVALGVGGNLAGTAGSGAPAVSRSVLPVGTELPIPGVEPPVEPTTDPSEPPAPTPTAVSLASAALVTPTVIPVDSGVPTASAALLTPTLPLTIPIVPPTPTLEAAVPPAVHPLLDCVAPGGDGSAVAFFGYRNEGQEAAEIPIGPDNRFSPAPADRGQPTVFGPGRAGSWPNALLAVHFDGGDLAWTLNGETARATSGSALCAYRVHIQPMWHDARGVQMSGPPANLPAGFAIAAQSDLGAARCTVAGDSSSLSCEYTNHPPAQDDDGLWVLPGATYVVQQSGLPVGWRTFAGIGTFPVGGSSPSFIHVVDNRPDGAPSPTPVQTPSSRPSRPTPVPPAPTQVPGEPPPSPGAAQTPPGTASPTPAAVAQVGPLPPAAGASEPMLPQTGAAARGLGFSLVLLGAGLASILTGLLLSLVGKRNS
jgi:hypothetical protein